MPTWRYIWNCTVQNCTAKPQNWYCARPSSHATTAQPDTVTYEACHRAGFRVSTPYENDAQPEGPPQRDPMVFGKQHHLIRSLVRSLLRGPSLACPHYSRGHLDVPINMLQPRMTRMVFIVAIEILQLRTTMYCLCDSRYRDLSGPRHGTAHNTYVYTHVHVSTHVHTYAYTTLCIHTRTR